MKDDGEEKGGPPEAVAEIVADQEGGKDQRSNSGIVPFDEEMKE